MKRGDCVGPSIMLPDASFVAIVANQKPGKANTLATSSRMVVPAAILEGLVTVNVNFGLPVVSNDPAIVPGPIPFLSISIVEFLVSIAPPGKGKIISIVFIVPVVAVLKKKS